MSARRLWRRQWPWLLGAVLLAAAAVVGPYWDRQRQFRVKGGQEAAQVVAAGAWARYAGVRWRLREVATRRPEALPPQLGLPANARVAIVTLAVNPEPGMDSQSRAARCTLVLRDGRGRGWRADPDALSLYMRMAQTQRDCSRPRDGPRIGPYPVKRLFMLPDDVAIADLRLELQLFPLPADVPTGVYLEMQLAGGR